MVDKHKNIMLDEALTRLIRVTRTRLGSKGRDFDKERAEHLKKCAQFRMVQALQKHNRSTNY